MSKYLKVDSLSKHYKDKKVLNNISFNVNKGQIIGLVGKNGAGKSTVLKILSLILDFEGDVLIEGRHNNSIRIGSRSNKPHIMISNSRQMRRDLFLN